MWKKKLSGFGLIPFSCHEWLWNERVNCWLCLADIELYSKMQTIVIFPLTIADIYSDAIRQQAERASTVELTLEDTIPGKPPKGSVKSARATQCAGRMIRFEMLFLLRSISCRYQCAHSIYCFVASMFVCFCRWIQKMPIYLTVITQQFVWHHTAMELTWMVQLQKQLCVKLYIFSVHATVTCSSSM